MAYSAEISRKNPSCFIFLIDQSASMGDVLDPTNLQPLDEPVTVDGRTYTHSANGPTKASRTAEAINRLLSNLVIRCTKEPPKVRDYYYISVIGYSGNRVGPAIGGLLSNRELVPISEIAESPIRVERRKTQNYVEDGAGGVVPQTINLAIWLEPEAVGGTPMCAALAMARNILSNWLIEHPDCFPPVVMNITDGEATDGDPSKVTDLMATIRNLSSNDGNVLLFNLHVTSNPSAKMVMFPASASELPDAPAKLLFEASSYLLPAMQSVARREYNLSVEESARGFVCNGRMESVIIALDIGSRDPRAEFGLR